MKLIIENWRKFLLEEQTSLKEFYHATMFPVESFLKGIDIGRAKGFGQGEGFYVFTDKNDAIKHAKDISNPNSSISKEVVYQGKGTPKIIVINPPLTSENFDIDYEFMSSKLVKYITKSPDTFLGMEIIVNQEVWVIHKLIPKRGGVIQFKKKGKRSRKSLSGNNIGTGDALYFAGIANKMKNDKPELFRQFEEEVLQNVDTLKYNGKETIYPIRIEDIDGNVIWSK